MALATPDWRLRRTVIINYDVEPFQLTEYHPHFPEKGILADERLIKLCQCSVDSEKLTHNIYFGKIITGETFVKENRNQLFLQTEALCVDMETASIAHVCFVYSMPFIAVRTISDIDGKTENQFGGFCLAAKNSFIIVRRLIKLINNTTDIR